jgi:glucose-1-phosphate thymidylyltransferase
MKYTKALLLSGGSGSRLKPITNLINKHFLPVFDKPMIFYSLSIIMLSKIRDICIVSDEKSIIKFKSFFNDGKWLGIKFTYLIQKKPLGISNAIKISEKFIKKSNFSLMLGDNFFYGGDLTGYFNEIQNNEFETNIFSYNSKNPNKFGVVKETKNKIKIIEKPNKFISNRVVPGLYFLPNKSIYSSKKLKKSKRNEFEITDLLNILLLKDKYKIHNLNRGVTWMDLGTLNSLIQAGQFIRSIEDNNFNKIACLEEISLKNNWISKINIKLMKDKYGDTDYFNYLKKL